MALMSGLKELGRQFKLGSQGRAQEREFKEFSQGKGSKSAIRRYGFTISLDKEGVDKLNDTFKTMEEDLQKKALRFATREVAKFTLQLARQESPVDTGSLKKSLKVRAARRSRKNKHQVISQVTTTEGLFRGDEYYAGFLEFGTQQRKNKKGANRGRISSNEFAFLRKSLNRFPQLKMQTFIKAINSWMETKRDKAVAAKQAAAEKRAARQLVDMERAANSLINMG